MGKIYEIIRPKSLYNADYEEFEYLIRWIGRDGSDYLFMFFDAEIQQKVTNSVINRLQSDNIESLITQDSKNVTLTASDLTKKDVLIITEMFSNKFVTRLKKSGNDERFAVDANSFKYRLLSGTYEVSFTIIANDLQILK